MKGRRRCGGGAGGREASDKDGENENENVSQKAEEEQGQANGRNEIACREDSTVSVQQIMQQLYLYK